MTSTSQRLGRPFAVLCGSSLFFYLSMQVLLPVMPLYAASLGGREAHVGLIVGVFAFAAMLLRPVAGHLADRIGRRPLVVAGAAIFALSALGYGAVGSLLGLLALRLFHGVGMGLHPTAASVVVADLAPPEQRGRAMGLFGLTATTGMAFGPYVGIEVLRRWGFPAIFGLSAAGAMLSVLLAWTLPETRPAPGPAARPSPAAGHRSAASRGPLARVFSVPAIYPSLLLLALYFAFGGIVSFMPLFTERLRLGNAGLYYTAFALAVLVVRPAAGVLADRLGRRLVAVPALTVAGAGLIVLATTGSIATLILSAVLYGIGFGAGQPALMAMTTDRVRPEERGRAMGTFFTAWELGISGGSVLLGLLATRYGYPAMWGTAALVALAGAVAAARDITRPRG